MVPNRKFMFETFVLLILFLDACQSRSRYIVGFMKNKEAKKLLTINIFNPNPKTSLIVRTHSDMNFQWRPPVSVPSMTDFTISLSSEFEVTETGRSRKGILIESTEDLVVVGVNRVTQATYTYVYSFLAIPVASLGLSYYAVTASDRAEILVVVGFNVTSVNIKVNGRLSYEGHTYQTGDSFKAILNEFDTLLLQADEGSLTGTHITSDKVVSVYSGNEYMAIGMRNYLVQQVAPVHTLDDLYILVPPTDTEYDVLIVAAYPSTSVAVIAYGRTTIQQTAPVPLEVAGSFSSMFMGNNHCVITSNEPVSVTMLVRSTNFDPAMIRIQPIVLNMQKLVVFVRPNDFNTDLVLVSSAVVVSLDNSDYTLSAISPRSNFFFIRLRLSDGNRNFYTIKCEPSCSMSAYLHGHLDGQAMGYPVYATSVADEKQTPNARNPSPDSSTQTKVDVTTATDATTDATTTIAGSLQTGVDVTTATGATTTADDLDNSNMTTSTRPMGEDSTYSSGQTDTIQLAGVNTTTNVLNQTCNCQAFPCPTTNYSLEQLEDLVAQLRQELLVQKKATTKHIRTLTSAPDDRTSSKVVGYAAGIILATLGVGLLILDMPNLLRMFKTIKHNLSST